VWEDFQQAKDDEDQSATGRMHGNIGHEAICGCL
jgi:hypothetical protein